MDPLILRWLKAKQNKWFESPRVPAFNRRRVPDDFRITYVNETDGKVGIRFRDRVTDALPLHFWMFTRTIQHLQTEKGFLPIGAAVQPPYIRTSVEEAIWRKPFPTGRTEYKASSHVCDFLALMNLVEYGPARSPDSGRRVQGVRWTGGTAPPPPPPPPESPHQAFLRKFKSSIQAWIEENEAQVIEARNEYSWKGKSTATCVDERNKVSRTIVNSRIRNQGAVDLDTLDQVMKWGGFHKWPDRDDDRAIEVTSKAFKLLDEGNVEQAVFSLMSVHRVGIASATKVLGLSDQEALAIYDSRVGHALRTLTHKGEKLIHSPPGRSAGRGGDPGVSNRVWAQDYQKLIWILEVFREHLKDRNSFYRIADFEMGLFMMGK